MVRYKIPEEPHDVFVFVDCDADWRVMRDDVVRSVGEPETEVEHQCSDDTGCKRAPQDAQ